MGQLKANFLSQTKQQNFTKIYADHVCAYFRMRNSVKTPTEPDNSEKQNDGRRKRRRGKQKILFKGCYSHLKKSLLHFKTLQLDKNSATTFDFLPTISLTFYSNLLQQLVGILVCCITASTAISITALLYYLLGHTQVAAAILNVTATPASLQLSLSSSHKTPLIHTTSIQHSVPFQAMPGFNSSKNSSSSIIINLNSDRVLDLNNINSTEIAILNGISSLPSVYNSDNKNNTNYDINFNGNHNNSISVNFSLNEMSESNASEYIFDRTDVRIIFITLYTVVFCCCFFGNLLVILVVSLSRRLRSITNFFLANLAVADFCVGLFCVMQNLSIYLIDSWVFGQFLCRMYQFVHSLSYTASIFILVVICMERYFAIVHPISCKQILTSARLKMVILTVWITSAVYSTPKFVFSKTIKNVHTESGREEEICVLDRKMYNSKLLDMINFGLLYVIPLLVMTILYSKIAIALWRSSRGLQHHLAQQENGLSMHNSMYQHQHQNHNHNSHQQLSQQQQQQLTNAPLVKPISLNNTVASGSTVSRKQSCKYDAKRGVNISESQVSLDADRPVVSTCRKASFYQHSHNHLTRQQQQTATPPTTATAATATATTTTTTATAASNHHHHHPYQRSSVGLHGSQRVSHISHSSNNVLRARRGVVRMLIIFVLTFALCNLPYHARKMWQYWSRSYRGDSNFNALLTPLTFLVTYFNSAINPLLYAFLSRNFRKGMKELLMCSWRKSKTKSSTNSSMHHKRLTLQNHSLPTDTTHIGNEQM